MKEENKTKKQLISELEEMRQRVAVLGASNAEHRHAGEHIEKEIAATAAVINDMLRGEIDDVQTEKDVLDVCLAVTDSTYGMIGRINERGKFDTTTYNGRTLQDCAFPEALAYELSKEMTIRGIWGWPMLHASSLICNDLEGHPDRVGFPKGHAPLSCFLGVPLMRGNEVVGMLAVANKPGGYTEEDRAILTRLSSVISVSHQHRLAIIAAKKTREELEALVEERTKELREEIAERKHIQDKLIKAELRYRTIADFTFDWEWWHSPEGDFIYNSPSCKRVTGRDASDFYSDASLFRRIIHPDDLPIWDNHRHLSSRGELEFGLEFRVIHKDGSEHWIEHVCQPVFDDNNRFIGTRGSNRDITRRKQAETLLAEKEERFRIASNITSDVVYERDIQTGIATFFSDIDSHLGYEPGGFPRTMEGWREHAHPKDLARIDKINLNDLKPGITYSMEYRMRRNDGTYMTWLDRVQLVEKYGRPIKFIGAATNITESKRAEQELKESEERYRTLLNTVGDAGLGIIVIENTPDQEATIVFSNTRLCDMLGYSEEELRGESGWKFISLENLGLIQERHRKRQKGRDVTRSYEVLGLHKDGTKIPVEVYISVTIYDGKPATVAYVKDITERKKIEEEQQRIEKLESIGTLAGGIAHDFNNYLASVTGNISLVKRYGELKGEASEWLEEAEEASIRAKDLTQQLLTFSKGGAPLKKLVSLSNLIKEVATFILHGSKVKPLFSLPEDLWTVEADEGQVSQVISNIVKNADEAMPEGGVVEISARNITVRDKSKLPLSKGRYIEITITDPGIGIKKEYLAKIFEPYFTAKQKGSGLGLATSYSIIKNHGGYISVDSTIGVGTVFHIYLPASKKQVSKRKEEEVVQPTFIGQGRILVMDDEEMIKNMLNKMLRIIGYEAELTSDGAEAIERYTKARESGEPFDAVIMDLTIPGGMGGKEAIKKLLEIDPEVKAIVSSGYSTDPIIADYEKYGFSSVVTKPYSIAEFEKTLRSLLRKK